MFAKLFEIDGIGQALFTIGSGDDGPEIKARISERNGLEPQTCFSGWPDNEDGWTEAERHFASIDKDKAKDVANEIAASVDQIFTRANT